MKKTLAAIVIFSSVVFLAVIGYAGVAPMKFAESPLMVDIFRLSGVGVTIGIIYFVTSVFAAALRSGNSKKRGR